MEKSVWQTPAAPADPAALSQAWLRVMANAADAAQATITGLATGGRAVPFDAATPMRAMAAFGMSLMRHPMEVMAAQAQAMDGFASLMRASAERAAGSTPAPVITPERGDRRFSDPAWTEEPYFAFLKDAYLVLSRECEALIAQAKDLDPKTRSQVEFLVRQSLHALAPTNFPMTNPKVIRKALETGGLNLLGGLANLLEDAATPEAVVQRRAAAQFEVGKDLAITPGSVVFQNELMQLIQYRPATETVYKRPLLYVPPLVNKYYMMDLQPKSSFIKWLVDQGHTVFVISWVNPDASLRGKNISDYVLEGPVAALDAIEKATGETEADIFSFCMGGTLTAMALAYLAATGKGGRVSSATLIGAMVDYADLRDWSAFSHREQMEIFEDHLETHGMVAAADLQKLFSVMRANDLIWSSVVDHYLLDQDAPPSDLLAWFEDGANIPEGFMKAWSKDILEANRLIEKGTLEIGRKKIDLSKIKTPVTLIALKDDHVSAWEAVYAGVAHFGGPVRFILGGSGHNAGVINHPSRNKHGYWMNEKNPDSAEAWLAGAAKKDGSWWPEWQRWLTTKSLKQAQVPAREIGAGTLKAIESAPGSYVLG